MNKTAFSCISFLVVDNNSYMRRLVCSLLHGFGSRQVHEAEDGAAGLQSIETYRPDIVITDWNMPIFNGLELIHMIRNPASCKNSDIPIIMLTARTERQRVMKAHDAGATAFLAKPISARILYDRINSIVTNPHLFVQKKNYTNPDNVHSENFMDINNIDFDSIDVNTTLENSLS